MPLCLDVSRPQTKLFIYLVVMRGQGRGHPPPPPPKCVWEREVRWSPGKVLGFSCILDTFYDNLKPTDLVYFQHELHL
jgi:hypothetical protein